MSELPTCVAISETGVQCTQMTYRRAPFPMCFNHAFQVYLSVHHEVGLNLKSIHDHLSAAEVPPTAEEIAMRQAYKDQAQVYYIRIGDYIKIGYSENLGERIKSLRVEKSDVMAAEPGGREKERERHEQFANIRRGLKENFERTPELLTHIARVRREHGAPRFTVLHPERPVGERRGDLFKRRLPI